MHYLNNSIMTEEKLQKDLVSAMKEKNNTKVDAIRSIKAAILNEKTNSKFHELSDSEIIGVIQKLSKQRKEAADIYVTNNRPELAKKELSEKKFIDEYLPKMMGEDELKLLIQNIFTELNVISIKQMGLVMKQLKDKYSGQYDAEMASTIIKSML